MILGTRVSQVQPPRGQATWLRGLRTYLTVMAVGNLVWETLHLPLYTIWTDAPIGEQLFAVVHCTGGDILIALTTLIAALLVIGTPRWPHERFFAVAGATLLLGIGYTAFSEWLNVEVRRAWAYSEWMPAIPMFGFRVGFSPLLQWAILPATAFAVVHAKATRRPWEC
jgi:hypothetical protein